ncbi:MAG TPA: glycoside hydrolase family 2 TIM barrel-domain containing protein, partial [Anaerolineaceae bacterium]|nr:glycoside hydrolase family 2 TIM barrel-domain containing protein [Anaerolineaceae bacterium]
VDLNQPLDTGQSLIYEVYDPEGVLQARAVTTDLTMDLEVANPRLWDLDTPNLYSLRISLTQPGDETLPIDWKQTTFGFRTVRSENGKIYLNDRPIYLRGALDQDYYPDLIYTTPSLEYLIDEFRKAKAMGLNCLRVHIKVADPRYYQAADQGGLLIWSELPSCGLLTDAAVTRLRETTLGMIRRDWNHPSLIIWTVINEAWGTELHTNPDHRQWLREMYAWVKTLDPTRLVVDNSPCFPNFHVQSDIDDFHFYTGIPDNRVKWDKWVNAFANRAAWIYTQDKNLESLPTAEHPASIPNLEDTQTNPPPLIVSEFGNWGLPDLKPLYEYYDGEPWWFETGWNWGSGIVYPHGVEQRFNDLCLDKVFGDFPGMARASQWNQFDAMKYEIESMRQRDEINGYVITEFTDLHWEANGLLDLLRNPKAYMGRLTEINADTVLLPAINRYAYWANECAEVTLAISHYGREPIHGATVRWTLQADGRGDPEMYGQFSAVNLQPAKLEKIVQFDLVMPRVDVVSRFTLSFELTDAQGQTIARNSTYLTVFPQMDSIKSAIGCVDEELASRLRSAGFAQVENELGEAPVVCDRFDARMLRYVQRGGKVLFLAETPEALETEVPGVSLKARKNTAWEGDWVANMTWMRKDLLDADLPGDGHFDMTYASVTPETVIASTLVRDFEHNVMAGMFVGWVRNPVGIVQRFRIGRGEIIVSTLRLKGQMGSDPMSTQIVRVLVEKLQP